MDTDEVLSFTDHKDDEPVNMVFKMEPQPQGEIRPILVIQSQPMPMLIPSMNIEVGIGNSNRMI